MKRIYGVISDQTTASEFLNKLYEAGLDDGDTKTNFASPIKMISSYTYLTELGNSARAEALNRLHSEGVIQEALSDEAEAKVFSDLTKGVVQLPADAEVAKFADNLYLGVIPPGVEYSWYTSNITRILIFQFYTEEVTTVQEAQETNEETGETETVERTVTEIVQHMNEFMLGSNNSNALAPAVAYELTTVYSGDILVKLAWCATGCPTTEDALKNVFSALTINHYVAKVENAGLDGAKVIMGRGNTTHSDIVFGASGPVGGFLLHTMKKETNGSRHAITIFNTDATPLYTWSAGSKPWDELDSTKNYPANVSMGGLGRIITADAYGTRSNADPLLTMAALAPIFTPAIDDIADTAKWMPQGPHDYSYFDNSGHIVMTKGNSPNTVFFADHGLYLYDGEYDSDNWSPTGLEVPDIAPSDMVNIERPEPSSWLPHASRFYAIFDCLDGLKSSGWMNTIENGEEFDMQFIGTPVINSDGSARFENSPQLTNSAWCPSEYGRSTTSGSISIAVVKFNNLTAWGDQTRPRDGFLTFLFGYVPSDSDQNSYFGGDEYAGVSHYTYSVSQSPGNVVTDIAGSYAHFNSGRHEVAITPDTWYIVVISPNQNSNSTTYAFYEIKSDGTYTEAIAFTTIYIMSSNTILEPRFYLGSYDGSDAAWRSTLARIGRVWENTQTNWDTFAHQNPPRASIDCKFVALGAADDVSWSYCNYKNEILTRLAEYYTGHYTPDE